MIEVDPPIDSIIGNEVYNTDLGATSVLTGIYSDMSNVGFANGIKSIDVRTGLYTDELNLYSANSNVFLASLFNNSLSNNSNNDTWNELYSYIFRTNSAIEGIIGSSGVSSIAKMQLLGEAKFLRSFLYFYLINLYGDVPLITSTNYEANIVAPRELKVNIYNQIIKDLIDAQNSLSDNYVGSDSHSATLERVRPNKSTAIALLSRVYLFMGDWKNAENAATKLIANSTYELTSLDETFLSNSHETIWALQPSNVFSKTNAALYVLLSSPNSQHPVYLSNTLLSRFESGDRRKDIWSQNFNNGNNNYAYSYKYKDKSTDMNLLEYIVVFRLAEQYLIRAEARAKLGNVLGPNSAESDLNVVRYRAGLGGTIAYSGPSMLKSILSERQVELFTEWGHRWLDLNRMNAIDSVMSVISPLKGGEWQSYKSLFPIPVLEIARNPSLRGHQNPGYPEQ